MYDFGRFINELETVRRALLATAISVVAALLLAGAFIGTAQADEYDTAYRAAVRLTHYEAGHRPDVVIAAPSYFADLGGNLRAHGRGIGGQTFAVYLDGVVILSSHLDDQPLKRMGWLVHEMVHALQDQAGMDLNDCATVSMAEAQAYAVQNRYLTSNGHLPQVLTQAKGWCH